MASTPSMPDSIRINRLHWPVTTLGYGKRIGIWFQGCSIHCPGCCSRDTWALDGGSEVTVDGLLQWVDKHPLEEVDGFTISGGEPFDQPGGLEALLRALRERHCFDGQQDILVYSGYPMERLQQRHAHMIGSIDALVTGPYRLGRLAAHMRGSDNQLLHVLTPLGLTHYDHIDATPTENRLQVHFDGQSVWLIGIPGQGDLERLRRRLDRQGIAMSGASWLA